MKLSTTFFKSSPLGHLITSGKSTSTIAWQTSFTIWQAVLFPIPNLQPRERRSSPVARCQKQMAKRFSTVMDFLNLVSFLFSVSFNLRQIKRKDSLRELKVLKPKCIVFPLAYRFFPNLGFPSTRLNPDAPLSRLIAQVFTHQKHKQENFPLSSPNVAKNHSGSFS